LCSMMKVLLVVVVIFCSSALAEYNSPYAWGYEDNADPEVQPSMTRDVSSVASEEQEALEMWSSYLDYMDYLEYIDEITGFESMFAESSEARARAVSPDERARRIKTCLSSNRPSRWCKKFLRRPEAAPLVRRECLRTPSRPWCNPSLRTEIVGTVPTTSVMNPSITQPVNRLHRNS